MGGSIGRKKRTEEERMGRRGEEYWDEEDEMGEKRKERIGKKMGEERRGR